MKTLVFCTSYTTSERGWDERHAVWLKALRRSQLHYDQLLIVDDASSVLPSWPDVCIVREAEAGRPEDVSSTCEAVLYTHNERLGRQSLVHFPGWYRSFAFGVCYGAAHGFEKIIHLESDAFLVSSRIHDHFNTFSSGWFALWCDRHAFPEIAIQAAAGPDIANMVNFFRKPYDQLAGQVHENVIPFTSIDRSFIGDRYGEYLHDIPRNADYTNQTHGGKTESYYWWIPSLNVGEHDQEVICELNAPFAVEIIEGGWAGPEPAMWMVDFDSTLYLPPSAAEGAHALKLELIPCIFADHVQQRLYILVNDVLIDRVLLSLSTTILSHIPSGILSKTGHNRIRFLHPDAFVPSQIGSSCESRNLSVALVKCSLIRSDDLVARHTKE